jgi:D-alanyl-D-alanine carboxypeptidase
MRNHNFKLIFSIFLILAFCISCSGDKNLPLDQKLQKVLDDRIKKYKTNGVSAAVIFSDDKKWVGTSGISHDTVSIRPEMVFAVGSITKNFVAALTLKLAEQGILSLNDPISKWLPDYPHIDSEITIRQLLNHTSGIYMFWSNE